MRTDPEQARIHAAEAKDLRESPAFQRAVLGGKQRLLLKLADTDPLDTEQLRTIQANIRALDLISEMLADEIIRGTPPRQVGMSITSQDQRYG